MQTAKTKVTQESMLNVRDKDVGGLNIHHGGFQLREDRPGRQQFHEAIEIDQNNDASLAFHWSTYQPLLIDIWVDIDIRR